MSYVPAEEPHRSSSGGANQELQTERMVEELGNGLHAMAQPLTILRGTLWSLASREEIPAEFGRYLDTSNREVERLCELMTGLQKLLEVHQFKAARASFDVSELAVRIAHESQQAAQVAGLKLVLGQSSEPVDAIGDAMRTEYALRTALKISIAISPAGDTLELMILPRDGHVALVVRNISSGGKRLGSYERFFLSLAQTGIVSQSGTYECVPHPFSVTLTLPAHLPGAVATEERISL